MSAQRFTTTDVLRLEVEVNPTGLANLVTNPDGVQGGWGWITPVAGSFIEGLPTSASSSLRFTAPATSTASYFTTEPMPISAGQYAAAAWDLLAITGYVRVRFEWLNSSYALLSSSTQSGYLNTVGTAAYSPQQAPASTAFVRLRFDHYSTTAGAAPAGNAQVSYTNVKVAKAATSGALGSGRTNLIANPSFETDTSQWLPNSGTALIRSTTYARYGTASLRLSEAGVPSSYGVASAFTTVTGITGGRDYMVTWHARAETANRRGYIEVTFRSDTAQIGYVKAYKDTTSTALFSRFSHLFTAPTGTTQVIITLGTEAPTGSGERSFIDAVMVTEGVDVPAYFDGATAASGTITYAWTGTAHQSTSTLTDTTLGSLVPTQWRNVLGPSHDIAVDRESLNLGTLTATILDAALDPSQTTNLRPGRRVRLLTLDATTAQWTPLFTGKATQLDVTYDEKARPAKPPRISLVAVDNTQALAAARRPDGVGTIYELPYVLEGAGVPWRVNGSGNQVATATVVSNNDNATALDQIAITRDSKLGTAFVDRAGVLVANDYVATTPAWNFDVDLQGWTAAFTNTIARVTTPTADGSAGALRSTTGSGGSGASGPRGTSGAPVVGGTTYRLTAKVRAATTPRLSTFTVNWFDSTGANIWGRAEQGVMNSATAWVTYDKTYVAPPKAAYVNIDVVFDGTATGEVHYVDSIALTPIVQAYPLDETVYSDLDVSFSSTRCINSVTVKLLSWDPTDPTKTIETVYGPYEDATSIASWGRRDAEFTVHGISDAAVAAYAASILTRNANPAVQVNSVTVPVRAAADIAATKPAIYDLGHVVAVTNTAKGINQQLRVNRLSHRIAPDKWLVTFEFDAPSSVASPQATPPVQSTTNLGDGSVAVPAVSPHASSSKVWRDGRTVTVLVNVTAGAALAGNTAAAVIPAGSRPPARLYFTGLDFGSGSTLAMYVDTDGGIKFVFDRTSGQVAVGVVTYLTGAP